MSSGFSDIDTVDAILHGRTVPISTRTITIAEQAKPFCRWYQIFTTIATCGIAGIIINTSNDSILRGIGLAYCVGVGIFLSSITSVTFTRLDKRD